MPKIDFAAERADRCGAIVGSGMGGIHTWEAEFGKFLAERPEPDFPAADSDDDSGHGRGPDCDSVSTARPEFRHGLGLRLRRACHRRVATG